MGKITRNILFLVISILIIFLFFQVTSIRNAIFFKILTKQEDFHSKKILFKSYYCDNMISIRMTSIDNSYKLIEVVDSSCSFDCNWYMLSRRKKLDVLKAPRPSYISVFDEARNYSIADCIDVGIFNKYLGIKQLSSTVLIAEEFFNFLANQDSSNYKIFKNPLEITEFIDRTNMTYRESTNIVMEDLELKSFDFFEHNKYYIWFDGIGIFQFQFEFENQEIRSINVIKLSGYNIISL